YTHGADATFDANLDGTVDDKDATAVANSFNVPGTGEWFFGDFDYDGICSDNDVTQLVSTYLPTAAATFLLGNTSINEGDTYTLNFADIHRTITSWLIHWDDGSSDDTITGVAHSGSATHPYTDGLSFHAITVTATPDVNEADQTVETKIKRVAVRSL